MDNGSLDNDIFRRKIANNINYNLNTHNVKYWTGIKLYADLTGPFNIYIKERPELITKLYTMTSPIARWF